MRASRCLVPLLACLTWGCSGNRLGAASTPPPAADHSVTSNILRSDYAGSAACAACHGDIYEAWSRSPMHRMTRVADTAEIRAPFDGSSFHFKDDVARLDQNGKARFVTVSSAQFGNHVYRVTRVIGGRYREDFAGVEVAGASPDAPVVGDGRDELLLPVSYVFSNRSFRLKGYSVMARERPGLRAGGVWNQTCIFCHNTVPYFSDMLGALYGKGAPAYQGEVVDAELPAGRRAHFEIRDAEGTARAAAAEIAFLGGERPREAGASHLTEMLGRAISTTRDRFGAGQLVEVGIGCESCHGGSRDHAAHPDQKPTFEVTSPLLQAKSELASRPGSDRHAESINRACARCHQVLFTRYPYTWEGGQRSKDPGGSHITSGEARDWLLGGCGGAMACTTCHDPHGEDSRAKLDKLATPDGNEVCSSCHTQYRDRSALAAHSHHDPSGTGSSCVGCHMPKKNMGLGYALTRYHRIGSPNDPTRVEHDRPLECALCHVDKSVEDLVSAMERFWGRRYDRQALSNLYGDIGRDALSGTLVRGKPHEKAVAIALLGEHRDAGAADAISRQLTNAYPLVRYYARAALTEVFQAPCEIDLDQEDADIERDARAFMRSVTNSGGIETGVDRSRRP